MNCNHARRLFPAFWDDETTQAEREWLEAHFAACPRCRREYETYARMLETLGSMPRAEAAHDFAERALQRALRAETAPDRLPSRRRQWVPVTAAAAAVLLIALTLLGPWFGAMRSSRLATNRSTGGPEPVVVRVPERVNRATPAPSRGPDARRITNGGPVPDNLFDHSEDVEFVLDPVMLRRGRASVTRSGGPTQGERAVITF
jgi:anti-sigma factor RsiW